MNQKNFLENKKKNYSLGIIGGGQLALMLAEAANNRGIKVCIQTKSSNDPAVSKADHLIEADPLKVKGNRNLIKECEKIIFENEWIKIEKLNLIGSNNIFEKLKLTNIVSKYDDGNNGWIEQIPFDRIIFTAASKKINNEIFSHIENEGIIVCPIVKNNKQILVKYIKQNNKIISEEYDDVLFVPNLQGVV